MSILSFQNCQFVVVFGASEASQSCVQTGVSILYRCVQVSIEGMTIDPSKTQYSVLVKYQTWLGVRLEFRMGIWGIDEKDLASTCKKLHPSDQRGFGKRRGV
jgi:hypothetical protein